MHIHISSYHSDMKFDDYWNYFDLSPYKIITNTTWFRSLLCKLQWRVRSTRSRKWSSLTVRQLLARGWWSSPASFTTKTGRHDIAEILLKVALNKINQIKSIYPKEMSTNARSTISFPCNYYIAWISPLKSTGSIFSKFRYDFIIFIFGVLTPYLW